MQINVRMNGWNGMFRYTITVCLGIMFLLASLPAWAVQVNKVSLQKAPRGDVVTIVADAPMTYELFDLKFPARLVVNLPGATLKKGLEPLHSDSPGVRSVFPVVSSAGVRLEIGMDRVLTYKIDEQGKKLVVHFAASTVAGQKKGSASAAVLKDIDVRDNGAMTELILRGDHMDASHDAFMTNQGRTLILDFWGATSMLPKEHYAVSTQKIRGITVGQAKGRVRLVVNLIKSGKNNHQIEASPEKMLVRFGDIKAKRNTSVMQVEDVHFQTDDRIAHIIVRTNAANPVVNIHEKKGNVLLDIKQASLAAGQERTQDVQDFPGPVKQVDAYTVGKQVRIVARTREKVEISSFQRGNVLTLTLVPEDIAVVQKGGKVGQNPSYSGQKVTFDFKDIEVQNALKLIAEMSNLNIIMSDGVTGKLTMHLVDVPWDQALDLILSARGLGKEREGNVLRIAPLAVLQAENAARLQAQKTTQNLEPLITEFISLSYAKVVDVKTLLEGAKSSSTTPATGTPPTTGMATASSGNLGLSSSRGTVLADTRTNTLIVHDTQAVINNIKRLIAKIDRPQKQVLISARIVEASSNFSRDLGVRWGGQVSGHGGKVTNRISSTSSAPTGGGFLVDLPAAVSAGAGGQIGLAIGALNNAFNLNLELSAAEADSKIKIISSPRIVTMNLKKATISQGTDIPFVNSTSANSGTSVTFKKATLSLEVTPQITAENSLLLHILATKDAPSTSTVSGNPIINTKKIETDVFMDNGETIVIGGIYTRDKENTTNGVPGLSKIPIIGWLFKKNLKKDNKTELLIFLTPKILQNQSGQGNRIAASD